MSGTLAIPVAFGADTAANPPALPDLDTDLQAVATYVNVREISFGLLANRAAAGTPGRYYFATDVQGGTFYADDGSQWNQLGPGVTVQAPQNTVIILASYHLASFGG